MAVMMMVEVLVWRAAAQTEPRKKMEDASLVTLGLCQLQGGPAGNVALGSIQHIQRHGAAAPVAQLEPFQMLQGLLHVLPVLPEPIRVRAVPGASHARPDLRLQGAMSPVCRANLGLQRLN